MSGPSVRWCSGEGRVCMYGALAFLALMGCMGPKRAGACVSGISLHCRLCFLHDL